MERAERLTIVARDNLARRIGQPIAGPLDLAWFERVEGYGPAPSRGSTGTLALAAAQANVTTAAAQARLAQSQRVPDVTLSASARRLEATNDVTAVFGVSIPFPVFNRGSAAVLQQLDLLDAERTLSQTRTTAIDALAAYRDAQARRDRLATPAPDCLKKATR